MIRRPCFLVTILAALAGCGGAQVRRAPGDAVAPAKPAGCRLEIFYNKAPPRAFDELGELNAHVTNIPKGGAVEALHDQACALGADALVVTREQVLNEFEHTLVTAIAIRWTPAAAAPPAEAAPAPAPTGAPPAKP